MCLQASSFRTRARLHLPSALAAAVPSLSFLSPGMQTGAATHFTALQTQLGTKNLKRFCFQLPSEMSLAISLLGLLILWACGFKYASMGISTMTLDPVDLFDSYLSRSQAAGLFLVRH